MISVRLGYWSDRTNNYAIAKSYLITEAVVVLAYLRVQQTYADVHKIYLCLYKGKDKKNLCFYITCDDDMLSHITTYFLFRGRHCRDRMVGGFTPTFFICAISAYHHKRCESESRSCRGVLDTTLCDKGLL